MLAEDKVAGLVLPTDRLYPRRLVSTMATSEALVRFDTNDYSVPVGYSPVPPVTAATFPEHAMRRWRQLEKKGSAALQG